MMYLSKRWAQVFVALVFLLSGVKGQILHSPEQRPSFEVATVKLHDPKTHIFMKPMGSVQTIYLNLPVRYLIAQAYGSVPINLVLGGRPWIDNQTFSIEAKIPQELWERMQSMSSLEKKRQVNLLLQSLLAERFGLKLHFESRVMPVFELVLAKSGLKISPVKTSTVEVGTIGWAMGPDGLRIAVQDSSMQEFASALQTSIMDRPILNRTDVSGVYTFRLKISPEGTRLEGIALGDSMQSPSVFTALGDLGLKLQSAKDPIETVLIDNISMPTEN